MVNKTEKFSGVPLSEAASYAAQHAESQEGKDYKVAEEYFKSIFAAIEDEDEIEEIEAKVKIAMVFASHELTHAQFSALVDLVNVSRECGWEDITGDNTGDHGLSGCGSVWEWVVNSHARKGEVHRLSIEKEGDDYSVNLWAVVDGPVNYRPVAEARLSRADLISLLMAK